MASWLDQLSLPRPAALVRWEESFDYESVQAWHSQRVVLPFYITAAYLVLIYAGSRWMSRRPAYSLRGPLIAWNAALAIFSLYGSLIIVPEFFHNLLTQGVRSSICDWPAGPEPYRRRIWAWTWLFSISKIFELGDTAFIILRKQRLIYLHWIHHVITCVFCLSTIHINGAIGRWGSSFNYSIHTVMYGYYAARAARLFPIPRLVSMIITVAQTIQMFVCIAVFWAAWYIIRYEENPTLGPKPRAGPIVGKSDSAATTKCNIHETQILFALGMYLIFAVLFINFFIGSYLTTKSTQTTKSNKEKPSSKKD